MNAISRPLTYDTAPYIVAEHIHGDTRWVAIRARGAEWSWLTPQEAVAIGHDWVIRYGSTAKAE
jgi:hypothetical protein